MIGFSAKRKKITVGLETTYNDGTVPTQDIETSDLVFTPLDGPEVDRNRDRSQFGSDISVLVGSYVVCEFMVELSCSGALGVAPVYRDLLLASAMAETVAPAASVAYTPVSDSFDSAVIRFNHAGNRHALLGGRATMTLNLDAGTIPKLGFRFMGLYDIPVEEAPPADNFAQNAALAVNNANSSFALHGENPVMQKLSLGWGLDYQYVNNVGDECIGIYDRGVTGSIEIYSAMINDKNWFEAARLNETGPLLFTQNNGGAGHIVSATAPAAQLLKPNYRGQKQSITAASLNCPPSAGDDDLSLLYV